MVAPLQLCLLGGFLLVVGDQPIEAAAPRLQALLAYLTVHRDRRLPRAEVAFALWPDSTGEQARTNLRNLLFHLRRLLPDAGVYLVEERHHLGWRSTAPVDIDVARFEQAISQATESRRLGDRSRERAALLEATGMYAGDLLPAHDTGWILTERERLRDLLAACLERQLEIFERDRDYVTAIAVAQRLIRADPLQERNYLHLLRLQAVSGDRGAALATYRRCAALMESELGVGPSPELVIAFERLVTLGGDEETGFALLDGSFPLVGRIAEWDAVRAAWRRAERGAPLLAVVAGEAGIGKTRLAEELIGWAHRQGIATAVARCYAAEGELAYEPVIAWLRSPALTPALQRLSDGWLAEVARLLPEVTERRPDLPVHTGLIATWQRQRLFDALSRAITAIDRPLLLFIDDIQWCDSESLAWLHNLMRFHDGGGLLIASTLRIGESSLPASLAALFTSLRRRDQIVEIELPPLDTTDTVTLASAVANCETLSADIAERILRETEGNPLFIIEMVRAGLTAFDAGPEAAADGHRKALMLPPRMHAAINARLVQLSTEAIEVIRVAAVIGRAFTLDVLARAVQLREDALLSGLEELLDRRIIREREGNLYDFSHDKLREVVDTALSGARLRVLHRQVARALTSAHAADLGPVSAQLAAHYEQAGDFPAAIGAYERAAQLASRIYANAMAIEHCNRAIALFEREPGLTGRLGPLAASIYERLADTLELTGRHGAALAAFACAAGVALPDDDARQIRLLRKSAGPLSIQRRVDEALAAFDRAEELLERSGHTIDPAWWHEWTEIQLGRQRLLYFDGRIADLGRLIQRVRPNIETHGTSIQRAALFGSRLQLAFLQERYVASPATVTLARESLAACEQTGDESAIALARFGLGFTLWQQREPEAIAQLLGSLNLAERLGDHTLQARCLIYLAAASRQSGQLDDTRQWTDRALDVATDGQMGEYVAAAGAMQAWIAWQTGDRKTCIAQADAALAFWREAQVFYPFQGFALWPLLASRLDADELSGAIQTARALVSPHLQRLPAEIEESLELAIASFKEREFVRATEALRTALAYAGELGRL